MHIDWLCRACGLCMHHILQVQAAAYAYVADGASCGLCMHILQVQASHIWPLRIRPIVSIIIIKDPEKSVPMTWRFGIRQSFLVQNCSTLLVALLFGIFQLFKESRCWVWQNNRSKDNRKSAVYSNPQLLLALLQHCYNHWSLRLHDLLL